MSKACVFVVDDEPKLGELFANVLRRDGYEVQAFVHPQAMLKAIEEGQQPDVVLADLMMPEINGIELLERLRKRRLHVPVIIMTAHSSVQTAVEAMRRGAFHYLQKPINLEEMRMLLKKALKRHERSSVATSQEETTDYPISGILGESEAIRKVRQTIEMLRDVPGTIVLIRGETGTGKNLVARTIHANSCYSSGRFVEINCAALPDNLLEAELFGYEKGAFTDARTSKPGLLEVADGGTVFLDEIDSMSLALQAKLLSFLESRTFRRLGGIEDIRVNVRILCATNLNLEQLVAEQKFRQDLFYRINVVNLYLPALREMGRDVLLIARHFIEQFNKELGRQVKGLTPEAEEKLLAYHWPGNVRELRNVLERAMIFNRKEWIEAEDLHLLPATSPAGSALPPSNGVFYFPSGSTLEELEKAYILHTLKHYKASFTEVAQMLGISKKTLWEKRKRYNLDRELARS
ncbi:sigma-54-dependent transcriptional regulator [Rhodothermus profundi]|uniref:DNA-binding transcriptional response regulator, NtrC family, contains REC, AAA-type ATPase, and a Fis-type DNA-binding domains n=1 Tax=Rhodothermus profundi TaxID=633813 RepID=A0A1M6Q5G2_9BACT|nr:sigma-54 dependent transcriptional regulator [Rhodothermus profundi]SHK15363.1 DNA-binding transcriptional response regulator, NtrC family, contains REC, AAA-type ATPase, and a Fis-type DNA-binding domains [Rhodothermus profundi]